MRPIAILAFVIASSCPQPSSAADVSPANTEAIRTLISSLQGGREEKARAKEQLLALGAEGIPAYIEILRGQNSAAPGARVGSVLIEVGAPAIEPLCQVIRNAGEKEDRSNALRLLAAAARKEPEESEKLIPFLLEILRTAEDRKVSNNAAYALRILAPESPQVHLEFTRILIENETNLQYEHTKAIVDFPQPSQEAILLIASLCEPENQSRAGTACSLFSQMGPRAKAAVPILTNRLEDSFFPGQAEIPRALKAIAGAEAIPALVNAWKNGDPSVSSEAREALIRLREAAVPALAAFLKEDDYRAAVALARVGPPGFPALLEADDADPLTRRNALIALAYARSLPSELATLFEALRDPDPGIRILAARVLAKHQPEGAQAAVQAALEAEDLSEPARQRLADRYFGAKLTDENAPPLPLYTLTRESMGGDRPEDYKFRFTLSLPGQKTPVFLDERRGAPAYGVSGFDHNSLELHWMVPPSLVEVTWSNRRRGSATKKRLIMAKVDEDWVPAQHLGPLGGKRTLGTSAWSEETRLEERLEKPEGSSSYKYLYYLDPHEKRGAPYKPGYYLTRQWPCSVTADGLKILPGRLFITLTTTFPIRDLARFIYRRDGGAESILPEAELDRIEGRIRTLNPELGTRQNCWGNLVIEDSVPPPETDAEGSPDAPAQS